METFTSWEDAFSACRERDRPLVVRVGEEEGKVFPSGHFEPKKDRPVPPFSQEPAFNSPESIALAAGTIQGFTPVYEVRYVEAKSRLEECVASIHAEDGTELASVWGRGDGEEGRAVIPEAADNARLFGAAPDFLAERDRLRAEVERLRASHPKCAICGKPAACLGRYDIAPEPEYACGECCGHGNEDGWCVALAALPSYVNLCRQRDDSASNDVAEATEQRDALADALKSMVAVGPRGAYQVTVGERALAAAVEALRKAGR